MICVEHMRERIEELETLGSVALAVHTGVDQQRAGRTPLDDLALMRQYAKKSDIFVAGGISSSSIKEYLPFSPEVLIVGGGICSATDPAREAKMIHSFLHNGKQ